MERSGGRSSDEREAAREARERARDAREQGIPLEGDEERPEASGEGSRGPDLGSMSRYGGGSRLSNIDVYTRRRLVAGLAIVALIVILFLVFVGC